MFELVIISRLVASLVLPASNVYAVRDIYFTHEACQAVATSYADISGMQVSCRPTKF